MNAQKMICEAFGYKKILKPTNAIFKVGIKQEGSLEIVDNSQEKEPCAMCEQVHDRGYTSKKGAAHLLKSFVSNSFNECYALKQYNFICEFCGWSIVSYGSPVKMKLGQKIINVLVTNKGYERMHFNSDANNDLYEIIKNPPKPPFAILINSRGTVLENLVFTAKATISKKWIVVNYGLQNLEVSPVEVFSCIEDARQIAAKTGIAPSSDNIFNRQDDLKIKPSKKLRENADFRVMMSDFLNKYNRDCRLVSKMILAAYLKENKDDVVVKESVVGGLFDF